MKEGVDNRANPPAAGSGRWQQPGQPATSSRIVARPSVDANGVDRSVPAACVLATRDGQWPGSDLRLYDFHGCRTQVPPLRDVAVIAWHAGADIALRCGPIHGRAVFQPSELSILAPGQESRWAWRAGFQATVLYLNQGKLADIAAQVSGRDPQQVRIGESFRLSDPILRDGLILLSHELGSDRFGGQLYSDCIVTQLCVHLLRHYASRPLNAAREGGALGGGGSRRVAEYIDAHLAGDLSLEALAGVAGTSLHHFARVFRRHFGVPPHVYVQQRRLERARALIVDSQLPLKRIVCETGFCDQSHLTNAFRRMYATTPSALRKRGSTTH